MKCNCFVFFHLFSFVLCVCVCLSVKARNETKFCGPFFFNCTHVLINQTSFTFCFLLIYLCTQIVQLLWFSHFRKKTEFHRECFRKTADVWTYMQNGMFGAFEKRGTTKTTSVGSRSEKSWREKVNNVICFVHCVGCALHWLMLAIDFSIHLLWLFSFCSVFVWLLMHFLRTIHTHK